MPVDLSPVPPLDAIAALEARGKHLDPSFRWQEVYAEDHARAFTVAKSAGFDILTEIYRGLDVALREGKTHRQFAQELTPLLQAKGWWGRQMVTDPATGLPVSAQLGSPRRLELIFDVNMRVSHAAGHWASFERNKAVRPFLRYVAIMDEATRHSHAAHHNLVLPVDHPYWQIWAPPNGWMCRCSLQSLSQRDINRLIADGEVLVFEPPAIETMPWTNKATGEVRHVPVGIDPGWDYNPGQAGQRGALDLAEKLASAPAPLAARFYDDPDWLLRPLGAEFADWFDQAAGGGRIERAIVTVGALSSPVLDALAARGVVPQSGAVTVQQRVIQHMLRDSKVEAGRAAPAEQLRRLPQLLARPRAVLVERSSGELIYVFDIPEPPRAGKLVIKVDYVGKVPAPGGGRAAVVTNAVRTAGLVQLRDLRNPGRYELILGEL